MVEETYPDYKTHIVAAVCTEWVVLVWVVLVWFVSDLDLGWLSQFVDLVLGSQIEPDWSSENKIMKPYTLRKYNEGWAIHQLWAKRAVYWSTGVCCWYYEKRNGPKVHAADIMRGTTCVSGGQHIGLLVHAADIMRGITCALGGQHIGLQVHDADLCARRTAYWSTGECCWYDERHIMRSIRVYRCMLLM